MLSNDVSVTTVNPLASFRTFIDSCAAVFFKNKVKFRTCPLRGSRFADGPMTQSCGAPGCRSAACRDERNRASYGHHADDMHCDDTNEPADEPLARCEFQVMIARTCLSSPSCKVLTVAARGFIKTGSTLLDVTPAGAF